MCNINFNIVLPVGSEIFCVLHCCTEHVQLQKYEKYFMFTQLPPFQQKPNPEQDRVMLKPVEILQTNACNIIPYFSNYQNWWFEYILRKI
jgi:hypothetical protein